MEELLQKVYQQNSLSEEEMYAVAQEIFSGKVSVPKLAAFLMALKIKGETIEEIAGISMAMQQAAVHLPYKKHDAMDNCGTGGDKSNSFNISTTSAFVLAAGGIKMAKHGNRSISSQSGSADVCTELGIEVELSRAKMADLLDKIGIVFLFAPHMHPNMKYVMEVRKELKTPTIFNLIGPLTNPVSLKAQLMGIYRRDLLVQMAEVLKKIGRERAIVVNGAGNMDEASLMGENHYALLENGQVKTAVFTPEEVGLKRMPAEAIRGGDAKCNAQIVKDVLANQAGAYLDTVLLNAGLGFFAYGLVSSIKKGVELARDVIASGAAQRKLEDLLMTQKEILAE
ncbi:anthranilate phosphoribosyltransferase [Clostridia bacterium]|nr:anthranilate phosphoribosyltransferase [Clostridia bacterium]